MEQQRIVIGACAQKSEHVLTIRACANTCAAGLRRAHDGCNLKMTIIFAGTANVSADWPEKQKFVFANISYKLLLTTEH